MVSGVSPDMNKKSLVCSSPSSERKEKMSASPLFSASQVMLNYLIPLAAEQISLAWGFKDELQRLCDKLELIRALLRDAENRGVIIRLETIQLWLKKLKSVACCADDVLDELSLKHFDERLRSKTD
ncbi:hypothetical protein HYC85_028271 [Camellia sinensis]|uniref:Disease resistance N-terminal domain-containing protein n=1 Tax=Camellia sinensis TaxID=4442 RepID=A0A7J7FUP6_CAMSI|nr:hypothetical protein HYC85_028271 [Camellia sinensis]